MDGRNIDLIKYVFITINKHNYGKLNKCQVLLHAMKLKEVNVIKTLSIIDLLSLILSFFAIQANELLWSGTF